MGLTVSGLPGIKPPQGLRVGQDGGIRPPQGVISPTLHLPFNDLGAGEVNIQSVGAVAAPTFTRATTAWTRLASGLWASVASGVPRSFYMADGSYAGFLGERATTNRCLWSRDLSNVAWVSGGGGVSAAKDAVGIDGVAASASTLTASGAAGTLLQSITNASVARIFGCWMKRKTGTGTIEMTVNGGAGWTDVTGQINSSTWSIVFVPVTTLANPVVGFRIATNTDAVFVDMCQEEAPSVPAAGTSPLSPYPATTVAVTRNQDVLTYPTTGWFNALEGSAVCDFVRPEIGPNSGTIWTISDGTGNERILSFFNNSLKVDLQVVDGNVSQCAISPGPALAMLEKTMDAMAYKVNDFVAVSKDRVIGTDGAGTLPTVNSLCIGTVANSTGMPAKNFRYFNHRLSNPQLQGLV